MGAILVERSKKKASPRSALHAGLVEEAAQVPSEQAVAPEQADDGAQCQEGPEGHRILAPVAPPRQEHDGHRAAGEDAQQDGQQRKLPAEEGAHHRAELHVAPTHSAAADQDDHEEDSAAEGDAEQGIEPARGVNGDAERRPRYNAGDGDHVGDDLVIQVDARDGDESGQKEQSGGEVESGAEAMRGEGEEDGGEELYGRVAPGDCPSATPAASTEEEPGEHGHVVVPANGRPASGTGGARMHDADSRGKPRDHDIEEAADDETDEKGHSLEEPERYSGSIVHGLCSAHRRPPTPNMPTREG